MGAESSAELVARMLNAWRLRRADNASAAVGLAAAERGVV